jgi:hypothetical protein
MAGFGEASVQSLHPCNVLLGTAGEKGCSEIDILQGFSVVIRATELMHLLLYAFLELSTFLVAPTKRIERLRQTESRKR